jgi:hypothetical protein
MKLNEHSIANQSINLEEVTLPLEEQNILEWGLKNLMKNLLFWLLVWEKVDPRKKGKKKSRAVKKHPLDVSVGSKGDKSKVNPGFNLKDRNTIKKVYKW